MANASPDNAQKSMHACTENPIWEDVYSTICKTKYMGLNVFKVLVSWYSVKLCNVVNVFLIQLFV